MTRGSARRRRARRTAKRRCGARRASAEAGPVQVEVTRATVIDAAPLGELEAADAWLARAAGMTGWWSRRWRAQPGGRRASARSRRPVDGGRRPGAGAGLPRGVRDRRAGRGRRVGVGPRCAPAARGARCSPAGAVASCSGARGGAGLRGARVAGAGRSRPRAPREAALQLSVALDAALAELEGWRERSASGSTSSKGAARPSRRRRGGARGRARGESVEAVEAALGAARGRAAGAGGALERRHQRRISSSTSPSSRTAAKRSNGVALMVTMAIWPPASMRQLGQPGRRIDLQRGADAEHQVGAGGERRSPGSSPPRRASRRTGSRRA